MQSFIAEGKTEIISFWENHNNEKYQLLLKKSLTLVCVIGSSAWMDWISLLTDIKELTSCLEEQKFIQVHVWWSSFLVDKSRRMKLKISFENNCSLFLVYLAARPHVTKWLHCGANTSRTCVEQIKTNSTVNFASVVSREVIRGNLSENEEG